jgi:hypothetical protein
MMNDENRLKAIYRYADPFFMFMETCDALKAGNATSIGMQNFSADDFELVNGRSHDLWCSCVHQTVYYSAYKQWSI